MIDDQFGDLSLETDFQEIVKEYKKIFLRNLKDLEESVQAQLDGNGKYNIHYFFRRAEIFARCGEIYFVRILKVESSLIQLDLKYAYPKSELLDTLIKNYYEDLLNVKLKHSYLFSIFINTMQKSILNCFAIGFLHTRNIFLRTKQQVFCAVLNSYKHSNFSIAV